MESVRERQVAVYCTNWCSHSRRAKALLESYHVPYQDVDIERDTVAARQVESWNNGYHSVPTLDLALRLTEPSMEQLEAGLGLGG